MRVITESVRGITIHWPKGMPLAYMNKVQDFDGDKVWGVRDETREAETWAFVDYLDTKYPKTWFVARRMLTVTTGA